MARPTRFEEHRYLGDKRSQIVHDLDNCPEAIIDELMASRQYLGFGPDTLVEAANRCYKPCKCAATVAQREAESA